MRTHDFRTGRNGWGHMLHAGTWRELPPRMERPPGLLGRFKKAVPVAARASFMVHCSPWPNEGDRLLFTGSLGEQDVQIVAVKPCWDPRDMFTLEVEFDRPPPDHDAIPSAEGGSARNQPGGDAQERCHDAQHEDGSLVLCPACLGAMSTATGCPHCDKEQDQ